MRALAGAMAVLLLTVAVRGKAGTPAEFRYRDASGRELRATVITHPLAKIDPKIDATLCHAATIAEERAHARSQARCWHYVKEALLAAHVIDRFPKTEYAWEAGTELVRDFGFKRLPIQDPYAAPPWELSLFTIVDGAVAARSSCAQKMDS